ncbi:MAG: MBL fold metallo-hydrolase [Spirochaetales bacterium]|nr:MBL fold metallo-hydrolase [Spirochaetales bacterium]
MKIVFFGTAGAVQSASDGNVRFALRGQGCSLLVDASGSPVHDLLKAGLDPLTLDALVLTHTHTDHIYGLPSLVHNLWLMKRDKELKIISNTQTAAKARQLLELFGLPDKEGMFRIDWIECMDGENRPRQVAPSLTLKLFPVRHSVPTSGVRVEQRGAVLVYTADTAPFEGLIEAARGCRALIHEASGARDREEHLNRAGHSSARQAGRTAAQSRADLLFLCHFDCRGGPAAADLRAEAQESFGGEVIIPELFREYEIGET